MHKNNQKKQIILYLSYDGITDNLGQSQVLPYLIGLSQKNLNFNIISFEKKELYQQKKELILQKIKNTSIVWLPKFYTKKPPVLSTLFDLITLYLTVKKQIKKNTVVAIHCRSYITALVGLYFKKQKNIPFVFDMRGFWPDERVEGNVWNLNNYIFKQVYKFFKKKEKEFLNSADYIVSLTNNAKKEIISWKLENVSDKKIKIIPCCADLNFFSTTNYSNQQILETKNQLGISQNNFTISYLGSVGTWYMLDEMLCFFSVLKKHKANLKFLFITGDNPTTIYNTALKYKINPSELIIKKADRNEVPLYVLASNISLFFIKPSFSKKASSPTKMGEILGLGLPLICNSGVGDVGEIMSLFPETVINEFTAIEYERICSNLDTILATDKTKFIDLAKKYYELNTGVETYFSIYKELNIAK